MVNSMNNHEPYSGILALWLGDTEQTEHGEFRGHSKLPQEE
jgi:hypothetical protein